MALALGRGVPPKVLAPTSTGQAFAPRTARRSELREAEMASRRFVAGLLSFALASFSHRASAASGPLPKEDEVVNVIDGDTVKLEFAGRCRLIGMNTPETVAPRQKQGAPPDCYGPEASALTKKLLPPGTKVRLELDEEQVDKYGRQLVYLYRSQDQLFINAELLRQGAARRYRVPPNVKNDPAFVQLEKDAKAGNKGLWGACSSSADNAVPKARPERKTCKDFASYEEAKAWFDKYFPEYGDFASLDGDKDGKPCEKLLKVKAK
ncbi:unnamed protein product [Effrenium voratum]|uniref:TNase-like domain-containing protein n=1 Tax=Effrenium voratum TaxID=2562239 RepID=A0AA36NE95_9DINO|nr:unnamed protein product [Effrenium voratum]CAJ1412255.1 unnamed protein product [Effrenium voratum]